MEEINFSKNIFANQLSYKYSIRYIIFLDPKYRSMVYLKRVKIKKIYYYIKILLIQKWVKLVVLKEFVIITLNLENVFLIVYIALLKAKNIKYWS